MVIFIYGSDTYNSWQKLQQIKEKFKVKVDESGATIFVMDSDNFSLSNLREQLLSPSLFTRQRLIVLKNILALLLKRKKEQQEIIELLEKDSDNTIVFWEDTSDIDIFKRLQKSDIFTVLRKTKFAQEFKKMSFRELERWVAVKIRELGGQAEMSTVRTLVSLIGDDLWRLDNEIKKLVLYCGEDKITVRDFQAFVQEKLEDDIWKFTDALSGSQRSEALKLLADQLRSGSSPLELLNKMIWQFRVYLLVRSLLDREVKTSNRIARDLNLHPYVIQKSLPVVKKFTLSELEDIYSRLSELDRQLKSSQLTPEILLDRFIIGL